MNAPRLPSKVLRWMNIITALSVASAGIFLLLGLMFVGVGLWSYHDTDQFAQTARSSQGTVIELVRSSEKDSDGFQRSSSALCPVIEFTDYQGNNIEFQLTMCSYPPRYRQGERIEVLYAPDNPHHAKLKDKSMYLFSHIFSGVGIACIVIGFSLLMTIFFVRKWLSRKYRTAKVY